MTTKGFFGRRDHSNELSQIQLNFTQIAAGGANFDAVIAQMSSFFDELEIVSLCDSSGYGYRDVIVADPSTIPASNLAQRETGMRVFLTDDVTGEKSHFTVPGPDLANLTIPAGGDLVTLADGSIMAALVTSVEADIVSEAGNAVTVTRAVIVGRNN